MCDAIKALWITNSPTLGAGLQITGVLFNLKGGLPVTGKPPAIARGTKKQRKMYLYYIFSDECSFLLFI